MNLAITRQLSVSRLLTFFWGLLLALAAVPVTGQTLKQSTSLRFVPSDVAFYASMLRNREQFDSFVNSKAFQAIQQMPIVQMGWTMAQLQWQDPGSDELAQFKELLSQPENQQLVSLLKDAFSNEIFCYGDEGYGGLLALAGRLNRVNQTLQLEVARRGVDAEQLLLEKLLELLADYLETQSIPKTVLGFKVSDSPAAVAQLARLEDLLEQLLSDRPEWRQRLSRKVIGGSDFLTLQLDSGLIPWEEIPLDELSEEALAQLAIVKSRLSQKTFTISLGVRDGYLIASSGASDEYLQSWGQGELLADRREMQALEQHADQRVVGLGYASGKFLTQAQSVNQQMSDFAATVNQLLPLAELDEQLQVELSEDVRKLATLAEQLTPEMGALSSIEFLSNSGYEGYRYNWSQEIGLDGSQPLTILDHLGGDPLLAFAARGKYNPQAYDQLAEICNRSWYYAEKIALQKLDDDERQIFEKVRDGLRPVFEQLGKTTHEKCLPAFEDGQGALVVDSKATSQQWHKLLLPGEQPLPMLQPAVVYEISNAALVKAAASDYYDAVQKVLGVLHEAAPDKIPSLTLPSPVTEQTQAGSLYSFDLPEQWGLVEQVVPNAGLSEQVLVLSLFPTQSKRLLDSTPLAAFGPLAASDQPLAAAFYCNCAGFIDAIEPWVDYGMQLADLQNEVIGNQVHTALEVLKCFRGVASATYGEGDSWVSHYEVKISDLP